MLADVGDETGIVFLFIAVHQLEERPAEPVLGQQQSVGDVQGLAGGGDLQILRQILRFCSQWSFLFLLVGLTCLNHGQDFLSVIFDILPTFYLHQLSSLPVPQVYFAFGLPDLFCRKGLDFSALSGCR